MQQNLEQKQLAEDLRMPIKKLGHAIVVFSLILASQTLRIYQRQTV